MIAALLVAAGVSQADPTWLPDNFSLLCEATASTGFAFENGSYERANFTPERILIARSPEVECLREEEPVQTVGPTIQYRKICISERKFGEPLPRYGTYCEEMHIRNGDGDWAVQLRCENGAMLGRYSVDGRYLRSNLSGRLDQNRNERDDIWVEHGVCSRVS